VASKTDLESHQNLGLGLGLVFTENCSFGFGFKTDPALVNSRHSANTESLVVPSTRRSTLGDRAFPAFPAEAAGAWSGTVDTQGFNIAAYIPTQSQSFPISTESKQKRLLTHQLTRTPL